MDLLKWHNNENYIKQVVDFKSHEAEWSLRITNSLNWWRYFGPLTETENASTYSEEPTNIPFPEPDEWNLMSPVFYVMKSVL
jgi:hypothetical protein